jgi:adenylate kinase family enzyme
MRQYFVRERVVFQIVGVGGSGKSTLACALARWAMTSEIAERLDVHRMIPVFISEDTSDLLRSVTAQLRTMIGEAELDDEIVSSLLRHKRLLVIVDALSERNIQTQEYVSSLFEQQSPINALIMTTRREADLGALDMITIRTEPINARTLIPFIYEYLRRRKVAAEFDQRSQLRLGERVLALVENSGQITVTPLLVTLFVDSALSLLRGGVAIEELPPSIPDVFIDYLQRLNPKVPDTPNLIDDKCMLLASRALGRLSLRKGFVPSDFRRDLAETSLKAMELGYAGDKIIDRLIANGVLNERKIGGLLLLRYALDPVAEYLAAIDISLQCGDDDKTWSRVTKEISATDGFPERIYGFLAALSECYIAFRKALNFPIFALPWEIRDVSQESPRQSSEK